jgi:ATP-dependent exoDNAse (exonuclease V) alpha subunit
VKLILIGDGHQLGAVGPGGAFAAVVGRKSDVVYELSENRRRRDVADRQRLAELRDGEGC